MEFAPRYKPNTLKDEVEVSVRHLNTTFKKKSVYVFGYGSLLHSGGWYGRVLAKPPKVKDLIECELDGFERGPFGIFFSTNFYGIVRNSKKTVNGVLARIHNLSDWINLMRTENVAGLTALPTYRVIDVTEKISERLPDNSVIHTVCSRPSVKKIAIGTLPENLEAFRANYYINETEPQINYYEKVYRGVCKERSTGFVKKFLSTGGFRDGKEVETFINNF